MKMIDTNGAQCTNFLESIHTTKRGIINTNMFPMPTKICLLDFIGAEDYFITDFGAIWPRKKVYPNRFNRLTRGYLPLVILDREFPYQWSLLPTVAGEIWLPINQLLGWCFSPQEEIHKKYFLAKKKIFYPMRLDHFHWVDTCNSVGDMPSIYLNFMNALYA